MTRRNRPSMPPKARIHAWWEANEPEVWWTGFVQCDPGEASCYACGYAYFEAFDGLERGHLVDHALGGSTDPSNLVLICSGCNAAMPQFTERHDALAWVVSRMDWESRVLIEAGRLDLCDADRINAHKRQRLAALDGSRKVVA